MRDVCSLIWLALIGLFRSRASLQAEILTLRHQLNVLRRRSPQRLTLTSIDRLEFCRVVSAALGRFPFLELFLLIECRVWAERAIARLGDQYKNSRREMEIYASLSPALMHSEGSSERVREAFSWARWTLRPYREILLTSCGS
jgi:hypothetical protein